MELPRFGQLLHLLYGLPEILPDLIVGLSLPVVGGVGLIGSHGLETSNTLFVEFLVHDLFDFSERDREQTKFGAIAQHDAVAFELIRGTRQWLQKEFVIPAKLVRDSKLELPVPEKPIDGVVKQDERLRGRRIGGNKILDMMHGHRKPVTIRDIDERSPHTGRHLLQSQLEPAVKISRL
jgi:hypothetical protein